MLANVDAWMFAQRMEAENRERLQRYKRGWEYYNGDHARPLQVREGQPDDNVIVNLARMIVDKGVAFLFGKEVGFELEEGDTTPEEEALEEIWQRNAKLTLLTKVGTTGGIYGDVFLKLVPDAFGDGLPRIVNVLPEYVTALYDGQDIDSVWEWQIEWTEQDRDRNALHRRQRIARDDTPSGERWQVVNEVKRGHGAWQQDPDNPSFTWQWPWSPMIHIQNLPLPGSYYGASDLEDLSEQDAINYLASKMQRITRYHAHPKTVGSGFGGGDIKVNEDDTLILPGVESKLWNLEMQSDLSGTLALMDRLINWYLATARIPRIDPATINVGSMSGFALTVLYQDLLDKTEVKRRTYGDALVELNRRLLDMRGMGDGNLTALHWQDPLPTDEAAEQTRDQFELDNKLASRETVQQRRGLDPETENERIQGEEVLDGNVGAALMREFVRGQGA